MKTSIVSSCGRSACITRAILMAFILLLVPPVTAQDSRKQSLLAIQRQVEAIQPRLVQSTVALRTQGGSGSGVILTPDGYVLTAGHVVAGRPGRRYTVVLADGRSFQAEVVGFDRESDLGLARIIGANGLPSAPLGDSATLRPGQWVLALGHPLGQRAGRPPVLRIGRVLAARGRGGREPRRVATDAPLISGDSGGPLFDLNGAVVGINSMIMQGGRRMASLHVPVNLSKAALRQAQSGDAPDSWDGPPAALTAALEKGEAALQTGDNAAATRFAREAVAADPTSAVAQLLLARACARNRLADRASAALEEACRRGYNDAEALRRDTDFGPLARRPALAQLLARLDSLYDLPGDRKNDSPLLAAAADGLASTGQSLLRLRAEDRDVALGTVMSADGDILTKASELPEGPLTCALSNGKVVSVQRQGVDKTWDVALLKVHAPGLKPLIRNEDLKAGLWALTPDASGSMAAIGMVGVAEMPVRGRGIASKPTSKAYMGVRLEPVNPEVLKSLGLSQGVRVFVEPGLPAALAGMRDGDVLYKAEGQPVRDPDSLMDLLVNKKPGDTLSVQLARGEERLSVSVNLTTRPAGLPGRGGLPELLSGEVSRMQGPFPRVLQHDTVLVPSQMGGPLLDAEGHFIGMNIARADRTSTYAITAHDTLEIYHRLKNTR